MGMDKNTLFFFHLHLFLSFLLSSTTTLTAAKTSTTVEGVVTLTQENQGDPQTSKTFD
ncbi:transmembrane protein, putative [Medicago truncatula]|uniref:Transmembrane protein, putative n=1 Tax=Medicago truncatula TaxID=3880 RepID=A2Q4C7_MEDTR|nr:hypothetical protein MtrDRAFT_AC157472g32v2 [Medicago truncatula]AES80956.1 transmembrane protein, putative [Medicago truncatula]